MKQIIARVNDGPKDQKLICHFSGSEFLTNGKVLYYFDEFPVSPLYARGQSWELDPGFKLPESVNSRSRVTEFLIDLGVQRSDKNYFTLYKRLSEGLPAGEIDLVRPSTNRV